VFSFRDGGRRDLPLPWSLEIPARVATDGAEQEKQANALAPLEVPPFESIYAQYFDFVWSATRCFGVKLAALDDVVQEIFMVIHRKLGTLRQPESLRSWIYSIVRRTATDYHRTARTQNAGDVVLALHVDTQKETQPTPHELTEQSEAAEILLGLLGQLDPPKREVFLLVEVHGMTAPEISDVLGVPLNTVYTRLRAARGAFEAALHRRIAREKRRGGS
jgi:RNA polymerase sigma-70 factor (ECF subfamily)